MNSNLYPLISVIMPVYNAEKYLREAIDSILFQTYTNFELLLINDGSTDRSKDIILSYNDKRIRYIENETNLKLIATLNKGIDLATGEYIARMDADDISSTKRLETQMNYMLKHPNVDLCSTWGYMITEKGDILGKNKSIDTPQLINCSLFFTCPILHAAILCKADVLKNNKYKVFLHAEDLEMWINLRDKHYTMVTIPKYLYLYRWYGNNVCNTNADFQLSQKKKLLQIQLESFFEREMSESEVNLHHLSFELYRWGNKASRQLDDDLLQQEKEWFELISNQNKKIRKFPQNDLDAFLSSRWLVCCLYARKYMKFFKIKLPWYKLEVFYKMMKLLIYK